MLFITLFCSCLHRSQHWILYIWNEMFCLWTVVMLQQEVWSEKKEMSFVMMEFNDSKSYILKLFFLLWTIFAAFSFSPKSHKNQISPHGINTWSREKVMRINWKWSPFWFDLLKILQSKTIRKCMEISNYCRRIFILTLGWFIERATLNHHFHYPCLFIHFLIVALCLTGYWMLQFQEVRVVSLMSF